MRKIYTSIDIGSYSIKIVVCEMIGNNPCILASSNTKCKGIKNGIIVDLEITKNALLTGIKKVEDMLGFKINEAVVGISSKDKTFDIISGKIKIENDKNMVTPIEIEKIYQDIILGKVNEDEELLSIIPISFRVDDNDLTKDPKGMIGDILYLKAVIIKIPKENLKPFLNLFRECEISITDITLGAIGDYYEVRNSDFDRDVSAIINVGYDKTSVAIFNKGIMIKYDEIYEGSKIIDRELATIYNIKRGQARRLKEQFAVSSTKYADINDVIELTNKENTTITVNQLEVSEIVESKVIGLLNVAKKQINLLTNRKISNIIITGGMSELAGITDTIDNVFGENTQVLDIKTMGVRNNMYSTSLGLIKYFYRKLDFRNASYSMIKEEESNKLSNNKNTNKDSILNKVFGYFRDE